MSPSGHGTGWLARGLAILCSALLLPPHESPALSYQYADPSFPPENDDRADPVQVPFWRTHETLERVREQVGRIESNLRLLPPLQDSLPFEAYGYHSDYLPALPSPAEEPRWTLDFHWQAPPDAGGLAFVMVPARDYRSEQPKGYAFPKRFRLLDVGGPGDAEVVVDWTEVDHPDPGLRPVYFQLPDGLSGHWRLEVFGGEVDQGLEYFALGRVYPICFGEQRNLQKVEASSSYHSPPYWTSAYLSSKQYTLGLPIGREIGGGGDFYLPLQFWNPEQPLVIELDFGERVRFGWMNLFPAQAPGQISIPGYGFPGSIDLLVQGNGSQEWTRPLTQTSNPGDNLVRLAGMGMQVTRLRLECDDYARYAGEAAFAMGEIELSNRGRNLPPLEPPTLLVNGMPVGIDTRPLIDGRVRGREIIGIDDWLRGLAAGKPMERELAWLRVEEARLEARLQRVGTVAGIVGVLLLAGGLIWVGLAYWLGRKRDLARLRHQIRSDLHDDIGSKVAAIGLASTFVENRATEAAVRDRGSRIRGIAQRMHEGLRDVLWMTDDRSDTLAAVVRKLVESARELVPEEQLQLRTSSLRDLPKRPVKLEAKRDLLFFFKEVLHNAVAHADAEVIRVNVQWERGLLLLEVIDDGKGFQVKVKRGEDETANHLGLQTMRERAARLRGNLKVESEPGKGVRIEMRCPL